MPHIPLPEHLPGITGLLEYRQDSASPIRELTQVILRGPGTLSFAEREMIATVVSQANGCRFCTAAHEAVTNVLLGESETCNLIRADFETAPISDKMKALLHIAQLTQRGGRYVTPSAVERAKQSGATDMEIHDTVLIAALFCLYNKYVDGLATQMPDSSDYFNALGERIAVSYGRRPEGYEKPLV
ncbi:MAG TPA: carboxymuconolactone decarboxylase family protein [Saprospiraceae bacterium]|nr:carboxymuconolactone decarboxylase family protein [Saprospiraceae bacterium]